MTKRQEKGGLGAKRAKTADGQQLPAEQTLEYRNAQLLDAARKGDLAQIETLIEQGVNINHSNANGNTALILAAWNGHKATVEALLNAEGVDVNHAHASGFTALMLAAQQGHKEIVEALIKAKGVDVNTPLITVAKKGDAAAVKILLENGANIEATSNNGATALMAAALQGKTATTQILLKNGVNIEATSNNGATALMVAARYGHTEIVTILQSAHHQKKVDELNAARLIVEQREAELSREEKIEASLQKYKIYDELDGKYNLTCNLYASRVSKDLHFDTALEKILDSDLPLDSLTLRQMGYVKNSRYKEVKNALQSKLPKCTKIIFDKCTPTIILDVIENCPNINIIEIKEIYYSLNPSNKRVLSPEETIGFKADLLKALENGKNYITQIKIDFEDHNFRSELQEKLEKNAQLYFEANIKPKLYISEIENGKEVFKINARLTKQEKDDILKEISCLTANLKVKVTKDLFQHEDFLDKKSKGGSEALYKIIAEYIPECDIDNIIAGCFPVEDVDQVLAARLSGEGGAAE